MKAVESQSSEFVAWATDLDGHTRFAIVQEEPHHGLRWVRWAFDELQAHEIHRSQGCFYDGVPGHPEGALQWAIDCARASWERSKSILAEITEGTDPSMKGTAP
jgi:hypothetical protein